MAAIEAVFLSRFHPEKGPIVTHQVPDNAVLPRSRHTSQRPLFDFYAVADYIIPRQELCDAPLAVTTAGRRIVGHPVCITASRYARNEFIFNLALVVPEAADAAPYAKVARRVAMLLREAEAADGFLSADEAAADPDSSSDDTSSSSDDDNDPFPDPAPASRVHALCEMLMQDLNSYAEAMLTLDARRTLNVALRPAAPPPPQVRAWHVALPTRPLAPLAALHGWDLVVVAVLPVIDGQRTVAQVAAAADMDVAVARRAVAYLAGAGLVRLLDAFQFEAVYAPAPGVRRVMLDRAAQDRAAVAVAAGGAVDAERVAGLYASLGHGVSVKAWCLEHWADLEGVDVRKFITWGLLEGYIYRVHKYAFAQQHRGNEDGLSKSDPQLADTPLDRYLDGMHCFDSICAALQTNQADLMSKLKQRDDVYIIEK